MGTSATVHIIEGVRLIWCPLNTGFTVIGNNLVKSPNVAAANFKFLIATSALWIENLSQYKIL